MTAGKRKWLSAVKAANQFADGSLVLVDDTLDVDAGDTVDLRVRLGARPRSDVTVALSETSTLISLGTTSLTFTPANWDTFQSVTVTGVGNSQDIDLPAARYQVLNLNKNWNFLNNSRPQIDSGLTPSGADRFLVDVSFAKAGGATLTLASDQTETGGLAGDDLSSAFESSGRIVVTAGSNSETLLSSDTTDDTEPYTWPSSGTDFVDALPDSGTQAGSLTISDYEPGDATISLAASGPDEYSGVTGSATVSVN